jgi:tetratricopeptide (TPR) repeat protein
VLTSRNVRLLLLALLTVTLGAIVAKRGLGLRLGGPPAALQGPYATEEAWVVGEIVRDVAEMSLHPGRPGSVAAKTTGGWTYSVSIEAATVDVDLSDALWNPEQFAAVARALIAARPSQGAGPAAAAAPAHAGLVSLTPDALIAASNAASRALSVNMRDAAAHEAAAVALAGFALRESAWRFNDTRWALNRMTAHLAMVRALRGGSRMGEDGQLALATLLVLTGRQVRAIETLDALGPRPEGDAAAAWARSLRVRMTQDWRLIANPGTASVMEKHEFLRARRAAVELSSADLELETMRHAPDADCRRILSAARITMPDRWAVEEQVQSELEEAAQVFSRIHSRAMGESATVALNVRADRMIGASGPEVIPWGAWAEQVQRHLAHAAGRTDDVLRHGLGLDDAADENKAALTAKLGELTMFPVGTIFWTKGPRGGEADLRHIDEAVETAVRAPERVTSPVWAFLFMGARYEPVRYGMPPGRSWFIAPAARAAHEIKARLKETGHPLSVAALEDLIEAAPHDYDLAAYSLSARYRDKPPHAEVMRLMGARLSYDLRAVHLARDAADLGDAGRFEILRRSCDLSARECIRLAEELVEADRQADAAGAYEAAFADPSVDVVAVASASRWLVDYYDRNGRSREARALARRSGESGAWNGLITHAWLLERLGELDAAEGLYAQAGSRYDNLSELFGFYHRAVHTRQLADYEPRLRELSKVIFPSGLAPARRDETGRPAAGVIVTKDSRRSRAAGLQAGDIIVGLEGWRVENLAQYRAIDAISRDERMKLVVWRGSRFEVDAKAPQRLMGVELRSYPIEGWSEK